MASENLSSRGQAWFCTTGLPTDVVIEVGEMSFHLHKFPLMSKSRKLHHLITEREQNPRAPSREDRDVGGGEEEIEDEPEAADEEEEEDFPHICLPEFPGGVEAFEAAAKFCYGVKIELTASNVVPLRCGAEYLEMTDDFAEDNLVARTERFLAQSVLRSVRDAARALKSCEHLLPQAEDLGLVQRCVDAIAARASGTDLNSLFGWPILEAGDGGALAVVAGTSDQSRGASSHSSAGLWNGMEGVRRKGGVRYSAGSGFHDSWFEDLTALSLPIYKRVISAMKAKDLRPELIEGSLIFYAKRSIPGLSRSNRHHAATATPLPSAEEQRELLETLITNLPQEKSSGLLATRLLSGLLRTVNILRASEDSRTALERKIGSQLDRAALDDLLMPSYSYLVETLYDVDCVERIVGYFLASLEEERKGAASADGSGDDDDDEEEEKQRSVVEPPGGDDNGGRLLAVGKLVDGYLSEIASDANLKPDKFCDLALALPDHARVFDDGLYRAVDVYLKAHPRLTEEEREKVSGVMDCRKLTLEACTHAAQNERLPLRSVVQVLFFEQLQLRRAIAGTLMNAEAEAEEDEDEVEEETAREDEETTATGERARRRGMRAAAVRENQVLRLDMDSMRSRVMGLERECSRMRKALEKIDHRGGAVAAAAAAGSWGSLTRRLGCKFSTQVCDTTLQQQQQQQQHRRVVAPRKQRIEYSSP